MRFANEHRQSFDLALSGYAPTGGGWLNVRGEASDGARTWAFDDACLTQRAIRRLADWLGAIADGKTNRSEIDFLEPNLAFATVGGTGSSLVIRVTFEQGPSTMERSRLD